jgi:hypothetical protein
MRSLELCVRREHRDFPFVAAFLPVHARAEPGSMPCPQRQIPAIATHSALMSKRTHTIQMIVMPLAGALISLPEGCNRGGMLLTDDASGAGGRCTCSW